MRIRFLAIGLSVLIGCGTVATRGWASSPTEQVKATMDDVLEILKDPKFQGDVKTTERRERLRKALFPSFDFAEMAVRSLGKDWRHYAARGKEFVSAFVDSVEESYIGQIESYKNEKILYLHERLDENFAEVATKVVSKQGDELPISYRLRLAEGRWRAYDMVIGNISLINNYRSQFGRILATSSFDELLKRLTEVRSMNVRQNGARFYPAVLYLLLSARLQPASAAPR